MKAFIVAVVIASLAYCAVAEDRTITVLADKEPVLELTAPANAQVTLIKDKTVIETTNMFLYGQSPARRLLTKHRPALTTQSRSMF